MSETRTLKVVVVGNAKQAQAALKGLAGDASHTDSKVRGSGSKMASTFAKIGKSAALGFGVATVAAGAFVYKVGAPYEQTLNKIQVLTDSNQATMKRAAGTLESQSMLYAKMGQSVGDAAGGVVELTKSGLSLDKSLKAVHATMVLAKAGEMDVADASSLVANTLNTFSMKAGQAGDIANYLANAANISSADVSDLAETLNYVAPSAATAGVSLRATSALMAELANAGIKGSSAGTGLRKFFISLQAPTTAASKQLKALGMDVFDASGKMKPIGQIIDELGPKINGLADDKKAKALKNIFGLTGIAAATTVLKNGGKGFDEYYAKTGKAGAAAKLANSASKGLSGTVAQVKAEFVSLGQITYRALAPLANSLLKPVAAGLAALGPKIQPAVTWLTKLFDSFKGGGGGASKFASTFKVLKTFISALIPVVQKFAKQFMDTLKPALSDIADLFTTQILPAFRKFLPAITPVVKFLLNIIGGALIGMFKGAIDVIKGAMKIIAGVMNIITGLLTGDWSRAWEGVKQVVSGVLQAIWGAIQIWWNAGILSIFKRGILSLTGLWKGAWDGLKNLGKAGVNGLKAVLLKVVEFITRPFRQAFSAAKGFVTDGWAYIRGKFSGGVGSVKAIIGRIIEVVTYPYRTAFTLAKSIVSSAWTAIVSLVRAGIGRVGSALAAIKGKVLGAFTGAGTWLKSAGMDIIRGIVSGLDAAKHWITEKISEITDHIPAWFKHKLGIQSPSKVMAALSKFVISGITKGLEHAPSIAAMQKRLDSLTKRIRNAFRNHLITSGQKSSLLDYVKRESKAILKAVAVRASLQKKLLAAQVTLAASQQRLTDLTDARQSLRDSTYSATRDSASVLGLGDDGNYSIGALLGKFYKRLSAVREFTNNLQRLAKAGLSKSLMNQVAAAGPDQGGLMAQALVNSIGTGQLAEFNKIQQGVDDWSNNAAYYAGTVYDGEISAASKQVASQTSVVNHISIEVKGSITAERDLARTISKHIREEIERINRRNGKAKK